MYKYRPDDLFYDIEIRNNLFVDSQYFPAENKFIISYLDATDPSIHQDKRLFLTNANNSQYEFFKYEHNKEAEAKVIKHIQETNPTLTRANTKYEFENLLIPKDIVKFLKRLGLADQFTSTNGRFTDSNGQIFWNTGQHYDIDGELVANNSSAYRRNQYINDFHTENEIMMHALNQNLQPETDGTFWRTYMQNVDHYAPDFYPLKTTDHDYQNKVDQYGFRFGYNSAQYDMTMLASIASRYPMRFLNDYVFLTEHVVEKYQDEINKALANEESAIKYMNQVNSNDFNDSMYTNIFIKMINSFEDGISLKDKDSIGHGQLETSQITAYNNQIFENEKDKDKNWMPQILGDTSEVLNRNINTANAGTIGNDIFRSWRSSGRYVDIMRFNKSKLSLKRAAGMLGLQIKESSTNNDPSSDLTSLFEIADVIAYNVSDVYATMKVFEQKAPYQSTFDLNQELLKTTSYLVYQQNKVAKDKLTSMAGDKFEEILVRPDRLYIDATSTQFITNVIAPYKGTEIQDNRSVDFMYPDEATMKKMAQEGMIRPDANRFDVLEDTMRWAIENIPDGENKFMPIYNFYKQYRAKNVNRDLDDDVADSSQQQANTYHYVDYKGVPHDIPIQNWKMSTQQDPKSASGFYYDADGNPTASVWNVSSGGIHGAETKFNVYKKEYKTYLEKLNLQNQVKLASGNQVIKPQNLQELGGLKWMIQHPDQVQFKDDNDSATFAIQNIKKGFKYYDMENNEHEANAKQIRSSFTSKSRKSNAQWRIIQPIQLFKKKDGKYAVNDKFAYVSVGLANHEDFSSYYPRLISMLAIFRNADGVDTYYRLYKERLELKRRAKDETISKAERDAASRAQKVRKLLLNSGSGGGDATFESRIKCNNKIVSMRVIGQLFAWRIGQALALHGARVPSTNTDGLYTMDIDEKLNKKILDEQVDYLMLDIDPEIITKFVSKDANNRMEKKGDKIVNAKGGSLTGWQVGDLSHNLNHPAIVDRVLTYYLSEKDNPCDTDFDRNLAHNIFRQQIDKMQKDDPSGYTALNYLQWIIVSNPSSHRYIFATDKNNQTIELPHTNRFFMVKDNSPINKFAEHEGMTVHMAGPQTIKPQSVIKRINELDYSANTYPATDLQENDPVARQVIIDNEGLPAVRDTFYKQFDNTGLATSGETEKERKLKDFRQIKISNLDPTQAVYINNQGLNEYEFQPDVSKALFQSIDEDAYIDFVERWFNTSWKN